MTLKHALYLSSMPVKIYFPGITYSKHKGAIKATFPRTCKWDMKNRRGWFGKDLNITAHLRSGEPGTLYLEGKQEYIDSVVGACKQIVDSCQIEVVDDIPEFELYEPARIEKKPSRIDLSPETRMMARIRNEKALLKASGMSEEFIDKWIAIIKKEFQERKD